MMQAEFSEFTDKEEEAIKEIKKLIADNFTLYDSFKWREMKDFIFEGFCENCGSTHLPCHCCRDE